MKFFFPPQTNDQHSSYDHLELWNNVKNFIEEQGAKVTDRKIYSIDFLHNNRRYIATVGTTTEANHELVYAIFQGLNNGLYYCCTLNRGVLRGMPILIGVDKVQTIIDFEPAMEDQVN